MSLGKWLRFAAGTRLQLQGASDHLVSEAIYLSDPEGNGIEIYRDRPVEDWPIRDGAIAMATDPLDLEGIMQAGSGSDWSGFPDDGTIGHVHLQVGATQIADTFYEDLLGFRVTSRYPGASFYGSGGYHHQLAGNIWNSRGAPPRQAHMTGLVGLELLTPEPDVISRTGERIASAGYVSSPSGGGIDLKDPWGVAVSLKPA
jgi:catechol 2,3-dioxygenase